MRWGWCGACAATEAPAWRACCWSRPPPPSAGRRRSAGAWAPRCRAWRSAAGAAWRLERGGARQTAHKPRKGEPHRRRHARPTRATRRAHAQPTIKPAQIHRRRYARLRRRAVPAAVHSAHRTTAAAPLREYSPWMHVGTVSLSAWWQLSSVGTRCTQTETAMAGSDRCPREVLVAAKRPLDAATRA